MTLPSLVTPENRNWIEREERTNQLVRRLAAWCFLNEQPTAEQIYGLAKLTWITQSYNEIHESYIRSTKIPALGHIFATDFGNAPLEEVAGWVASQTKSPELASLIRSHTGFTNLYPAYRNQARKWCHNNYQDLLPIVQMAYSIRTEEDGIEVIRRVAELPRIPNGNSAQGYTDAATLLTPLCFALDPHQRFPIINKDPGVDQLLRKLELSGSTLEDKYQGLMKMYTLFPGMLPNAAVLDQSARALIALIEQTGTSPEDSSVRVLRTAALPLKDESDVEAVHRQMEFSQRRIHNAMTNQVRSLLRKRFRVEESKSRETLFDIKIHNYDGNGNNLLVEVKSAAEDGTIRMAIGQLFHYWYTEHGSLDSAHLALLLPEKPSKTMCGLLDALEIGVMWLDRKRLFTRNDWLGALAAISYF
ncbi:hypothetical protein F183_A11020 [Bryobacterales bacterium F-183]|nr:hypothetical protein F183_A11020 [Bryobacterales bacterium F-183]